MLVDRLALLEQQVQQDQQVLKLIQVQQVLKDTRVQQVLKAIQAQQE
jgi:hypothetical protein